MLDITIIDTAIGTDNLGDEIIMDAVDDIVCDLFPDAYITRVPSHEHMSRRGIAAVRHCDLCLIGGTNILASPGWHLRWFDPVFLKNAICLGVTWGGGVSGATLLRRLLLRRLLSSKWTQSVRDNYAKGILDQIGIRSVSTACPTMWKLTPEHCRQIPRHKAQRVLFTLTAYRPDVQADRRMIEILRDNYKELYFFSQMREDVKYLQSLNIDSVKIINPTIRGYNRILESEDIDVIGSRLHGGIRALQRLKRTLIIGIDHRSVEIAKDTGLPVLPRTRVGELAHWINSGSLTDITLPQANITAWRNQFRSYKTATPTLPTQVRNDAVVANN